MLHDYHVPFRQNLISQEQTWWSESDWVFKEEQLNVNQFVDSRLQNQFQTITHYPRHNTPRLLVSEYLHVQNNDKSQLRGCQSIILCAALKVIELKDNGARWNAVKAGNITGQLCTVPSKIPNTSQLQGLKMPLKAINCV